MIRTQWQGQGENGEKDKVKEGLHSNWRQREDGKQNHDDSVQAETDRRMVMERSRERVREIVMGAGRLGAALNDSASCSVENVSHTPFSGPNSVRRHEVESFRNATSPFLREGLKRSVARIGALSTPEYPSSAIGVTQARETARSPPHWPPSINPGAEDWQTSAGLSLEMPSNEKAGLAFDGGIADAVEKKELRATALSRYVLTHACASGDV